MVVTLHSSISSLDRASHVQLSVRGLLKLIIETERKVAQIEAKREVAVRTFLQSCAGTLVLVVAPCA